MEEIEFHQAEFFKCYYFIKFADWMKKTVVINGPVVYRYGVLYER